MKATKTFATRVDKRSKKAMAKFLADHFRYHTMNSWNQATSYANNVKLYNVIPNELIDKAWEVMDADGASEDINLLISDFNTEHGHRWQAGFNGRSSGYVVLYEGGWKPSEHKRISQDCQQKDYRADTTKCGRCGSENMQDYNGREVFSYPGRSVDHDEDFHSLMEWSMDALRERVDLIQQFDALCDDIVTAFISLCENYDVIEQEAFIPTTRRVLTERA